MGSQQMQAGFGAAFALPAMHPNYAPNSAGSYFIGSNPASDPVSYPSLGNLLYFPLRFCTLFKPRF